MGYICYITFPTTYNAIRAEKMLSKDGYSFKMVPVPRSISSSCGTALRCSCDELDLINDYLEKCDVECEDTYKIEESDTSFSLSSLFRRGKGKDE